jgi:hypothetical protein
MTDQILYMKYEFFSVKGFITGACVIAVSLILESIISFPQAWTEQPFSYVALIVVSAFIVGIASGSVLIFLFPPDQDVIGLAGMGSDDLTQHIALFLVILSLVQPILSGFIFFYGYFGADPFVFIWVIVGFGAPSAGFAAAMYDRSKEIAKDLEDYFSRNEILDLSCLEWLYGLGPRTAVYRMGMLENAAERVKGLKMHGHQIVKVPDQFAINQ